jgi:hypothetical protein
MALFIISTYFLINLYNSIYRNQIMLPDSLNSLHEFRLTGCKRKKERAAFRRAGSGDQRRNAGCAERVGCEAPFCPHTLLPQSSWNSP